MNITELAKLPDRPEIVEHPTPDQTKAAKILGYHRLVAILLLHEYKDAEDFLQKCKWITFLAANEGA